MPLFIFLLLAILLAGCSTNGPSTPFLGKLTLSKAASDYCIPEMNGKYLERTEIDEMGKEPNENAGPATLAVRENFFAQGGGCVLKSVYDTWAVLHTQKALFLGGQGEFGNLNNKIPPFQAITPEPGFHFGFRTRFVKKEKGPFGLEVELAEWMVEWSHQLEAGTFEAPTKVNITYQKKDGISNLKLWHGAIVLEEVEPNVTAVAIKDKLYAVNAIQEVNVSEANCEDALNHVLENLRTLPGDDQYLKKAIAEEKLKAQRDAAK